tara:strand:- start:50 stop:523 length:474 start_codon:yes stop_codon:yes gene_type:complete
MKFKAVQNPKWANVEQTVIECEVDFNDLTEAFVPFSAMNNGDYPHTTEIFARCITGEFGEIAAYTPPADTTGEDALARVRAERNSLLTTEVDPIVTNPLRWAEMSTAEQEAWTAYRRALLDITATYPNPSYVWNESEKRHVLTGCTFPSNPIEGGIK